MSTYKFSFSRNLGSAQSSGNLGKKCEGWKYRSSDNELRHEQRIAIHVTPSSKSKTSMHSTNIY